MKTCQDDVTEKLREVCNGRSECDPNALKNEILDPNGCVKWNNWLLSRRYYFEVDYDCKETGKAKSKLLNQKNTIQPKHGNAISFNFLAYFRLQS